MTYCHVTTELNRYLNMEDLAEQRDEAKEALIRETVEALLDDGKSRGLELSEILNDLISEDTVFNTLVNKHLTTYLEAETKWLIKELYEEE